MKVRWVKFEDGWLPVGTYRERILELLGNDVSVLADIESALSRYFALMPRAMEKEETEKKVRKELGRLAEAITTINEIMQSRGRARSLFLDACGEYIEDGTLLRFEQLESALYDEGGDLLIEAARSASAALDVSPGRDKSPEKNARLHLVGEVARAVGKIDMHAVHSEGAPFVELMQLVYDGAGIEIKAQGDIKNWKERQRQTGAG